MTRDTGHCTGPVPARLKGRCGEEFPLCWASPSSEAKKGWNWIESRSPGVGPPQCVSLPSPARLVGVDEVWSAVGTYSRGVPVEGRASLGQVPAPSSNVPVPVRWPGHCRNAVFDGVLP